MKHYLEKTASFTKAKTVICFNEVNLSKIEIWRDRDLEIYKFDDIDELKEQYNFTMKQNYTLSDKKTFDSAYISFTKNLNELAKEL